MKEFKFESRKTYRFKQFARQSFSVFASMGKVVSIGVMSGITLFCLSNSAVAQEGQKPQKVLEKELEEVMVTASLTETPLEEVSKSIVVVTKQEIEQAPIRSINDLLTYVASVDLIQRGGHGVQADISIRGSSLDQVAVLINGINLSNAQTGHFALDIPINLSDIERIEILHGPSSLIYGSSAFSGGINIITKKDNSEKIFAQVETGMHRFRSMETRGSIKLSNTINSLSVGYKSSEGYIKNSDYDIYNLLWQTRLLLKKDNKLDFQLGYNAKKYGANTFYTAAFPNQYEENSSYMGTLKGEFGNKLKIIPILYWNRHHDKFELVRNSAEGRNYHRGDTYGGNLIFSYQHQLGTTNLSTELRKDELMSTNLGRPMIKPHRKYTVYSARTNFSTGIEHHIKLDKWNLSGGVLMTTNSQEYGKYYFLPSASFSFNPSNQLKIHTSWSKSVRVPTFTDLFYQTKTHTSNPKLNSEQSESWEIGAKYNNDFISMYTTAYFSWGRNIIDWIKEKPTDETWKSWNHSKINNKGLEVGGKLQLANLLRSLPEHTYIKVDYSLIYQDIDSQGMISLYSLNYLKNKVTMQFNHQIFKNLYATWFLRFQDRAGSYIKYEDLKPAYTKKYPAFSTLDLSLNYKIDNFDIHLNLNNLYNTKYNDLGNIPQAGFWLIGGVSYRL